MQNKFIALIIVIIIAICGVSAFLLTQGTDNEVNNITDNSSSNKTVNNVTNNTNINNGNTNFNGNTDENDITASLNGPKYSAEGKTVNLIWKITNNGNTTINNILAEDQSSSNNFGSLAPGESKTYSVSLNIPTLAQVKEDFGSDATVSNPFSIGGYSITYVLNGEQFQFNSNSLEIKLV
ncbi:hypothetical protein MARBORIA2_01820 [Methanobrevibacter arboriphilus]|jgi:uncharacterized protein YxeA|uniref:Uncharacterized protein n=1 Tax=Methanobrevibacter arboriphilus TaxID=39441 RepID=A0ACA8R516_METAZ|nr:hypothetical protein [Methanobrevibacter arboriphilus]BBL61980.1 hypothetical protein MarbSA_10200 [Methanobrevibacter arboriphilus]GLI11092.1 hypothetical protein MARBORIA2_01820 [Methanobrevibacter arboriphilus]